VYEFHTLVDPNLEGDFKKLVSELKTLGYIPVIGKGKEAGSDYVISVIKKRKSRPFGIWINLVLLVATMISTIYVGALLSAPYFGLSNSWELYLYGFVYFSFPLLVILGSHELGHYFVAKKNGVAASLPFFIPLPVPPLGTMGAFISLRDPLPDRKTLIKIGAAGPLVGFFVSIVVGIIGASLGSIQRPVVITNSQITTLIYLPVIYYIFPAIHISNSIHPVAFAAWVGFLVTAINLFPIGQLDGGHVARGLLGKNAKYLSYAFIVILVVLGIYYFSWILFAIIIIILGLNHPPPLNDISRPGRKEIMVGVIAIALVAICFSPVPFAEHIAQDTSVSYMTGGNNFIIVGNPAFNVDYMTLTVDNTNNYTILNSVTVKTPAGLSGTAPFNNSLGPLEKRSYDIAVWPSNNLTLGYYGFSVSVSTSTKHWKFDRNITVVDLDPNMTANNRNPLYSNKTTVNITIVNNGGAAILDVHKFNSSSDFYISGTSGIATFGNGTFLTIPPEKQITISVVFFNLTQAAGVIFVDQNSPWQAVAIFYIPPNTSQYNLLSDLQGSQFE
jgi:membrane-associated protease RseP (regulator of RpoE activity)